VVVIAAGVDIVTIDRRWILIALSSVCAGSRTSNTLPSPLIRNEFLTQTGTVVWSGSSLNPRRHIKEHACRQHRRLDVVATITIRLP
jgi:hypothetical protein